LDFSVGIAEAINPIDQQIASTVSENDREKEYAALEFGSKVLRHSASYHRAVVGTARRAPLAHPTVSAATLEA
jgi:hypothetical protein